MAKRPIVILHGWSDSAKSFQALARHIARELATTVKSIDLGEYESMNDAVTFDDIDAAMDAAWRDHGLPRTPRSVDVVVHSTGGLVIRNWMTRHFSATENPVYRLVMLAPANFGSPLAHKGRSFIGRVAKGRGWSRQVGERVLRGLEIASPFSWELAMRDRFGGGTWYGPGKTLCTVLVGNRGYRGPAAIANEDGGDGTVRVSTANLECDLLRVDLTADEPAFTLKRSKGGTAFGIADGNDHSSVVCKKIEARNRPVLERILRGLRVTDDTFPAWVAELEAETEAAMAAGRDADDPARYGYQNTVCRVQDDLGAAVPDYVLEFDGDDKDSWDFLEMFHRDVIRSVHVYGDDPSYRSLYVDCTTLLRKIDRPDENVSVRFAASPDIDDNGRVGYDNEDTARILIPPRRLARIFHENRTLLIDVELKRLQRGVFRFPRSM